MDIIEIRLPCPPSLNWMKWQEVIELDRDAKIFPALILEAA